MNTQSQSLHIDDWQRRKGLFDNTWMITIAFSAATAIVSWYLGISQTDVQPVIWLLVLLATVQSLLSARCRNALAPSIVVKYALVSQFCGLAAMGGAWHLFGGLQQPMFPLFTMLPLFAGALLLSFWQRWSALLLLLLILLSGIILTPDTNSFIDERYGISVETTSFLPTWIPRSQVAFADVTTTPAYDIMLTITLALLAIALTTVSGAIVVLLERSTERSGLLHERLDLASELNKELIINSPCSEALVHAATGRIAHASTRFSQVFSNPASVDGGFFLDAIAFSFPAVIKKVMAEGGEEIQGATVGDSEVTLRVRSRNVGAGASSMVRLIVEQCDDIVWRSALDTLEEPVLIINAKDDVVFLNPAAAALCGTHSHAGKAPAVLNGLYTGNRWWDIAPLDSTRRLIDGGGLRYMASIRRQRVVESLGDFSFIHLRAHEQHYAIAAS